MRRALSPAIAVRSRAGRDKGSYMIKKVLATTGVLSAALVLMAAPASAGQDIKTAAAAGTAPSCVKALLNDEGFTDHLKVTNNCKTAQRIKVVLAKHDDLACRYFSPGHYWNYEWSYPGRFDRLESC